MAVFACAFGQVKLPQVRMLETRGWQIQHSVMTWDSLTVYFSAIAPGANQYDLFMVRAEGMRWSEPYQLVSLCTPANELWPSISSDEGTLYYVTNSQIWRAWQRNGYWVEPAPIIISGSNDSQPCILEDNQTLLFSRYEDNTWKTYSSIMMDDHNWTLPAAVQAPVSPKPILAACGTIVMENGGRPLPTGIVLVYDALTQQLKQVARVNPTNGRWRVPLQQKQHYRIALTAYGFSYRYIDVNTDQLSTREVYDFGFAPLDNQLSITLNTYDAETQEIIGEHRRILPIGQMHNVQLQEARYNDTTIVINTTRPMIFTQTELDIPMQPKKSLHHFQVLNAKTGDALSHAKMRMNGRFTPADTTLRIEQELALQVTAQGFFFFDTVFHTGSDTLPRTVTAKLIPLEKNQVLQLHNIQFEYDSYELTLSSNEELEKVAQLLFTNPTLRIELASHTDDQGSDKYNDNLSTLRGKAVAEWLIQRGIDASRVESIGYGKRKPLVANDSDENRALNRRVEIRVIDF